MWDGIGSALKVFLEKHLIPTVIAIAVAIITLLILPNDNWMIMKIGKVLFCILVSCVAFLMIQIFLALWKWYQSTKYKSCVSLKDRIREKEESDEELEDWLTYADGLVPEDRQLLVTLLETNNSPIREPGNVHRPYNPDSIRETKAILRTKCSDGSTLIKLDDRFYLLLKQIYEERGSISHFSNE